MTTWSPHSWRRFDARQQPIYPDAETLAATERELAAYPTLVGHSEVRALTARIADAQAGRAFLLQGGDCAESFAEFSADTIRAGHGLFRDMSALIEAETGRPVIRLGRLAGQFAKPRSTDPEIKDGIALPAYRGDIVNGIAFDPVLRRPDPERMFRAFAQASATLSHLRALAQADDAHFYTSHEALLLPFEQALVRPAPCGGWFASSAHFLWLGDRTRFSGSAHVEFLRGIDNPIGIKCSPAAKADDLLRLLDLLDPNRTPGKITLICRMGHDRVETALPPLVRAVVREGRPVLWSCDPMHGNTIRSAGGYKTRPLETILSETLRFVGLVRSEGAIPGGVHLEMTGQDVTECTGGATQLTDGDLADRYHTHCDPRLNPDQAMELAALLSKALAADPATVNPAEAGISASRSVPLST